MVSIQSPTKTDARTNKSSARIGFVCKNQSQRTPQRQSPLLDKRVLEVNRFFWSFLVNRKLNVVGKFVAYVLDSAEVTIDILANHTQTVGDCNLMTKTPYGSFVVKQVPRFLGTMRKVSDQQPSELLFYDSTANDGTSTICLLQQFPIGIVNLIQFPSVIRPTVLNQLEMEILYRLG